MLLFTFEREKEKEMEEREREMEKETEEQSFLSLNSPFKWLQQPKVAQTNARSLQPRIKHLSHHLAMSWNQKLMQDSDPGTQIEDAISQIFGSSIWDSADRSGSLCCALL